MPASQSRREPRGYSDHHPARLQRERAQIEAFLARRDLDPNPLKKTLLEDHAHDFDHRFDDFDL